MTPAPKHTPKELERLVLDAAIESIEESSLLDFTMSDIAKRAGLSMGSIYKHVQSKEDVLVAIGTRMMANQHRVFGEVLALPLTTPERLIAVSLLPPAKTHVYSFGVHLELLIGNDAVLRRASSRWVDKLVELDRELDGVFHRVMESAAESGEFLVEPEARQAAIDALCVGLWSMSVGFTQVAHQRHARDQNDLPGTLPFPLPMDHVLIRSLHHLINAYPWAQPLAVDGIKKTIAVLEAEGHR